MKFVKGISLFVIYPLVMMGIGFAAGVELEHFFYPGSGAKQMQEAVPAPMDWPEYIKAENKAVNVSDKQTEKIFGENEDIRTADWNETGVAEPGKTEENAAWRETEADEAAKEVAFSSETLSVDTEYVLEETDILNHSVVETVWELPHKYVGMNREQFLAAMESYAAFPPLSERERGFVGLEVLSFSRKRVVVQMNYRYLQPGEGFYLAVEDNEVVVYQEDRQTVYIYTGILLDSLPDALQIQVIQMMWIEDEESLYDFLEAYSS